MIMRKILGKYIIGKGIVPFLICFEKLIKRLRLFMFRQEMDIYYHYKDRPYYQMLEEKRRNDTRLIEIYGKENL